MKKTFYLGFMIFIATVFAVPLYGQQIQISGTVRDAMDQQSLPGVNVVVKGTTTGTVTDINGRYQLNTEVGATLVFTFVGMKPMEIHIDGSTNVINVELESEVAILQEAVIAVSAIARDRETPVAISTISAEVITEKLGSQEFPEILKSTPSVYATKDGGGFGDGRINMRGFDSNNIGVLINGVPVNDMENGRVYWSNWAGLSDVTQTMQVQRGLGASRLAISSVGGTINIVTQTTEARKGGVVSYGFGHDGYERRSIALSTGLMDNDWAITVLGGRTTGQGFVDGTEFDGWSYFLNASKKVNDQHVLSFTAFGAPQWHNQRWPRQLIQTYRDHSKGIRYNPSRGILNGQYFNASHNEYHKPQLSLNHFWAISSNTTLSTSVYASISSGGGRRTVGERSDWLRYDTNTGLPQDATKLTPDGYLDFDAVVAENAQSPNGSLAIVANAVNAHDWYGTLSTLQTEMDNIKLTGGLDLRYYRGYHYQEITNLLGGTHYEDVSRTSSSVRSRNVNRDPSARLKEGDKIAYHDLGEVAWAGLFGQAEYITDDYSAFVSATLSNTNYRRTDYFLYEKDDPMRKTDWVDFMAWSVKGGANYNITQYHNVFVNGGYFTRAPFFRWAFQGFTNVINEGVKHERVMSSEIGYGLRSPFAAANVILYHTQWLDRALVRRVGDLTANITGLDAVHQGLEIDFTLKPTEQLRITGMFSYGDWVWKDNVIAEVYDDNQEFQGTIEVYAKDLRVGNSAQTTAALGLSYDLLENIRVGFDINHFDRNFADFNVEDRGDPASIGQQSWEMPSHQLMDVNLRYRFKIAGLDATLIANINNIFDTHVIRDATDGVTVDPVTQEPIYGLPENAVVYYGWGRTWTTTIRVRF